MSYPYKDFESKWQAWWEEQGVYHAKEAIDAEGEKFYGLIEFPYPSGEGLHVGHPRSYTAIDIMMRKKRMEGKNVLYPIGWDAFGLPTENFAIKTKQPPAQVTAKNIANFTHQIKILGVGFDWSREINTTDPKYYHWTQWMFIKFFDSWFDEKSNKARPINELIIPKEVEEQGIDAMRKYRDDRRMAFKQKTEINWCPKDKIGLANEEAAGGVCDRCGGPVEKREKEQWMLRITDYSQRLIDELGQVDYLDKIKTSQVNWIGRSEGASIRFVISVSSVISTEAEKSQNLKQYTSKEISRLRRTSLEMTKEDDNAVEVFTTRPDTIFGATYLVLSPDHRLIAQWLEDGTIENAKDVKAYQTKTKKKSDLERQENKEKTGVELKGVTAINPATKKEIPIWIADYVLSGYGTGAIMAVPAHDERDFEFAKKFKLPVIKVVEPPILDTMFSQDVAVSKGLQGNVKVKAECWIGDGVAVNSDFLDGHDTSKATEKIISWLEKNKVGEKKVTYKLRDWVFSRQRYWGEPIPMVNCDHCGWVPLDEFELPLLLPEVKNYEPTDTGESPLATMTDWLKVKCPICGAKARRETDTMPNWAGSSWYFLRYCDPHNEQEFASKHALKYWMPVDLYNGGMEHTTLHLLYSRFWYKVLFDLGYIPSSCGNEPYSMRRSHAMILGEGGIKMSKSKGNVVNPDTMVEQYGADVFRTYEMFIGPYEMDAPWSTKDILGVRRFLDKAWNLSLTQIKNYELRIKNDGEYALRAPKDVAGRVEDVVKTLSLPGIDSEDVQPYDYILNYSIKKVGEDIDNMRFNTAVSQLMILTNELQGKPMRSRDVRSYLKLIAPFAPHMAEELWHQLGNDSSIHLEAWPQFDATKIVETEVTIAVQVNGKLRGSIKAPSGADETVVRKTAESEPNVQKHLEGKTIKKVIYVKNKILNFIV
ncbi:MAG: class I tRNA ligase family protein [Patescibacteria group bacterium]|nr:class I tRNA ligase family protein [Patescibacteria group bacterium]